MAENVRRFDHAAFVGLPADGKEFYQAVVDLMAPLIDPGHEKALELMDRADVSVKKDNLKEAAELYSQARMLDPENLGAALSLAAVYSVMEKYERRRRCLFERPGVGSILPGGLFRAGRVV